MKRVIAVVLIAALTTMMVGVDRPSWAGQSGAQKASDKQRADVVRHLGEMARGSTATIELKDGRMFDVVIQEITADTVTVLRQEQDHVVTETFRIADIADIEKTSLKKMGTASKVLIVVAVSLGVLVVATLASCRAAAGNSFEPERSL
jgi:hypothetical protein